MSQHRQPRCRGVPRVAYGVPLRSHLETSRRRAPLNLFYAIHYSPDIYLNSAFSASLIASLVAQITGARHEASNLTLPDRTEVDLT